MNSDCMKYNIITSSRHWQQLAVCFLLPYKFQHYCRWENPACTEWKNPAFIDSKLTNRPTTGCHSSDATICVTSFF